MERKYGHSRNQSTHHTSVHITKRCTLYRRPTDNCYNGRVMTAAPMIGNHSPAWCSLGKWRGLRGSIMRYRASERRKLALNRLCTFVTALMVVGCDLLPRSPSIQIEALKGRILFVSHHSGNFDIYRINADGSDLRQLTTSPATDDTPAWSPDGQQIAFSSGKDIQIMNADGSGQFSLVHTAEDHSYPSWSPDGQQLAFMSIRDGNWEIYIMATDGSGATRITDHPGVDGDAVWSPDGRHLAFASDREVKSDIYISDVDGTGMKRLTDDPRNDYSPTWSPDGQYIAFVSERTGGPNIFVMKADGSGQTRIPDADMEGTVPAWSR